MSAKKTIKVTQIASPIRRQKNQRESLKALGLNKINRTKELEDNAIVRGLVRKVHHLVKVND